MGRSDLDSAEAGERLWEDASLLSAGTARLDDDSDFVVDGALEGASVPYRRWTT